MVNHRESAVADRWKADGWRPLRNGAPDYMMLKVDERGEITDLHAVEVKSPGDDLSYEQKVWREICKRAGIPFTVEVVE